jgi:hypothetical protein
MFTCRAELGMFAVSLEDEYIMNIDVNTTVEAFANKLEQLRSIQKVTVRYSVNTDTQFSYGNRLCTSRGKNITIEFDDVSFPQYNGNVPSLKFSASNQFSDSRTGISLGIKHSYLKGRNPTFLAHVIGTTIQEGFQKTDGRAYYAYGNGTSKIVFNWTVEYGDEVTVLDVKSLNFDQGYLYDEGSKSMMSNAVPKFGAGPRYMSFSAIALSYNSSISVTSAIPKILYVSSPAANGLYTQGDYIVIHVVFDIPIRISNADNITLQLETGTFDRFARYYGLVNDRILEFEYLVQEGDQSIRLNYLSTSALSIGSSASIQRKTSSNSVNAEITLPELTSSGSLAFEKNLVVDTSAPKVHSLAIISPQAVYTAGDTIDFRMSFNYPVFVTGTPRFWIKNQARSLNARIRAIPLTPSSQIFSALPGENLQILFSLSLNWDLGVGDRIRIYLPSGFSIRSSDIEESQRNLSISSISHQNVSFMGSWDDGAILLTKLTGDDISSSGSSNYSVTIFISSQSGIFAPSSGFIPSATTIAYEIVSSRIRLMTITDLSIDTISSIGFRSLALYIHEAVHGANVTMTISFSNPEDLVIGDQVSFIFYNFTSFVSSMYLTQLNSPVDYFSLSWSFNSSNQVSIGILRLTKISNSSTSSMHEVELSDYLLLQIPSAGVTSTSVLVSSITMNNGMVDRIPIPLLSQICGFDFLHVNYIDKLPSSVSSFILTWRIMHELAAGDRVIVRLPGNSSASSSASRDLLSSCLSNDCRLFDITSQNQNAIVFTAQLSLEASRSIVLQFSRNASFLVPSEGIIIGVSKISGQVYSSSCRMDSPQFASLKSDGIIQVGNPTIEFVSNTSIVLGQEVEVIVSFILFRSLYAGDLIIVSLPDFHIASSEYEIETAIVMNATVNITAYFSQHHEQLQITLSEDYLLDSASSLYVQFIVPFSAQMIASNKSISSNSFKLSVSSLTTGELVDQPISVPCYGFCSGHADYSTLYMGDTLSILFSLSYSQDLLVGSNLAIRLGGLQVSYISLTESIIWISGSNMQQNLSTTSSNGLLVVTLPSTVNASVIFYIRITGLQYDNNTDAANNAIISITSLSTSIHGIKEFHLPGKLYAKVLLYRAELYFSNQTDSLTTFTFIGRSSQLIYQGYSLLFYLPGCAFNSDYRLVSSSFSSGIAFIHWSSDDQILRLDLNGTINAYTSFNFSVSGLSYPLYTGLTTNSTGLGYAIAHDSSQTPEIEAFTYVDQIFRVLNTSLSYLVSDDNSLEIIGFNTSFYVNYAVEANDVFEMELPIFNFSASSNLSVMADFNADLIMSESSSVISFTFVNDASHHRFNVQISGNLTMLENIEFPVIGSFVWRRNSLSLSSESFALPCIGLCSVTVTPSSYKAGSVVSYSIQLTFHYAFAAAGDLIAIQLPGFSTSKASSFSYVNNDTRIDYSFSSSESSLKLRILEGFNSSSSIFAIVPIVLSLSTPSIGIRYDAALTYATWIRSDNLIERRNQVVKLASIGKFSSLSFNVSKAQPSSVSDVHLMFSLQDDLSVGDQLQVYLPGFFIATKQILFYHNASYRVSLLPGHIETTLNIDGSSYVVDHISRITIDVLSAVSKLSEISFVFPSSLGLATPVSGIFGTTLPRISLQSASIPIDTTTIVNATAIGSLYPVVLKYSSRDLVVDSMSFSFIVRCPLLVGDVLQFTVPFLNMTADSHLNVSVLASRNQAVFSAFWDRASKVMSIEIESINASLLSGPVSLSIGINSTFSSASLNVNDSRFTYSVISSLCPVRGALIDESPGALLTSTSLKFTERHANETSAITFSFYSLISILPNDTMIINFPRFSTSKLSFDRLDVTSTVQVSASIGNRSTDEMQVNLRFVSAIPNNTKVEVYLAASNDIRIPGDGVKDDEMFLYQFARLSKVIATGSVEVFDKIGVFRSSLLHVLRDASSTILLSWSFSLPLNAKDTIIFALPGFSGSDVNITVSDQLDRKYNISWSEMSSTLSMKSIGFLPADASVEINIPTHIYPPRSGIAASDVFFISANTSNGYTSSRVMNTTIYPSTYASIHFLSPSSIISLDDNRSKRIAHLQPGHELNEQDAGSLIDIGSSHFYIEKVVDNLLYLSDDYTGEAIFLGEPSVYVSSPRGRPVDYIDGSGTTNLLFRCIVRRGDKTNFTLFDSSINNTFYVSGIDMTAGVIYRQSLTSSLVVSQALPAVSNPLSVTVDTVEPSIIDIFTTTPAGIYAAHDSIDVHVRFTADLISPTGLNATYPILQLRIGPYGLRKANYSSGLGSSTLVFVYVVQAIDYQIAQEEDLISTSGDLTSTFFQPLRVIVYNQYNYLRRLSKNPTLDCFLNFPTNVSETFPSHVIIIGNAPRIISTILVNHEKTYSPGDILRILVRYSSPVNVNTTNGSPFIILSTSLSESIASATYSSMAGNDSLVFEYKIHVEDDFPNGLAIKCRCQDYFNRTQINLNGSIIFSLADETILASTTLALNNLRSSLTLDERFKYSRDAPVVISIASNISTGYVKLAPGDAILISVTFSTKIVVYDLVKLVLLGSSSYSPCYAYLIDGNYSNVLRFLYQSNIESGASRLDAVEILDGFLYRLSDNPSLLVNRRLPYRGSFNSLGLLNDIRIDPSYGAIDSISTSTDSLSLATASLALYFPHDSYPVVTTRELIDRSAMILSSENITTSLLTYFDSSMMIASIPSMDDDAAYLIENKYNRPIASTPTIYLQSDQASTAAFQPLWWMKYSVTSVIRFAITFTRPILFDQLSLQLNTGKTLNRAFADSDSTQEVKLVIRYPSSYPYTDDLTSFQFSYNGLLSTCVSVTASSAGPNSLLEALQSIPGLKRAGAYIVSVDDRSSSSPAIRTFRISFSRKLDYPLEVSSGQGICDHPCLPEQVALIKSTMTLSFQYPIRYGDTLLLRSIYEIPTGNYHFSLGSQNLIGVGRFGLPSDGLWLEFYDKVGRPVYSRRMEVQGTPTLVWSSIGFSSAKLGDQTSLNIVVCLGQDWHVNDLLTVYLPGFQTSNQSDFQSDNDHYIAYFDVESSLLTVNVLANISQCLQIEVAEDDTGFILPYYGIYTKTDHIFRFNVSVVDYSDLVNLRFDQVTPIGIKNATLILENPQPGYRSIVHIEFDLLLPIIYNESNYLSIYMPGFSRYPSAYYYTFLNVTGDYGRHFNSYWDDTSESVILKPLSNLPATNYRVSIANYDYSALRVSRYGLSNSSPPTIRVSTADWRMDDTPMFQTEVLGMTLTQLNLSYASTNATVLSTLQYQVRFTQTIPGPAEVSLFLPFLSSYSENDYFMLNDYNRSISVTWQSSNHTLGFFSSGGFADETLVFNVSSFVSSLFVNSDGIPRDGNHGGLVTVTSKSSILLLPTFIGPITPVGGFLSSKLRFNGSIFSSSASYEFDLLLNSPPKAYDIISFRVRGMKRVLQSAASNIMQGECIGDVKLVEEADACIIIVTYSNATYCQTSRTNIAWSIRNDSGLSSPLTIAQYNTSAFQVSWRSVDEDFDTGLMTITDYPTIILLASSVSFANTTASSLTNMIIKFITCDTILAGDQIILSLPGLKYAPLSKSIIYDQLGNMWQMITVNASSIKLQSSQQFHPRAFEFHINRVILPSKATVNHTITIQRNSVSLLSEPVLSIDAIGSIDYLLIRAVPDANLIRSRENDRSVTWYVNMQTGTPLNVGDEIVIEALHYSFYYDADLNISDSDNFHASTIFAKKSIIVTLIGPVTSTSIDFTIYSSKAIIVDYAKCGNEMSAYPCYVTITIKSKSNPVQNYRYVPLCMDYFSYSSIDFNVQVQLPTDSPTSSPTSMPSGQPSQHPSSQPSCSPSSQPSSSPTSSPTSQPSCQPSLQPSASPSSQPSSLPSFQPSRQPTSVPSSSPSSQPTNLPSQPSGQPSSTPTSDPSSQPTEQPSSSPTLQPSSSPSSQPTSSPTNFPSSIPTCQPTSQPSSTPSSLPSISPTSQPSGSPTSQPSSAPSNQPTLQPFSEPSSRPSSQPTYQPSNQPSSSPNADPSVFPSASPSCQPTCLPSTQPSSNPTRQPTSQPSCMPFSEPTTQPSSIPSSQPTSEPSGQPTIQPSSTPSQPSSSPTSQPSLQPSCVPSSQPSSEPSGQPTSQPSCDPSSQPSCRPSSQPSSEPTSQPSSQPTIFPTNSTLRRRLDSNDTFDPTSQPSSQPSCVPTSQPTAQPFSNPTSQPSSNPTVQPSSQPSSEPSSPPTTQPSSTPTSQPSVEPTSQPSSQPSCEPSSQPSKQPSSQPTIKPSCVPSSWPTTQPSLDPTSQPTARPTCQPSCIPSSQPTSQPSKQPAGTPSYQPSMQPSSNPTAQPSMQPSCLPSSQPTRQPTSHPTSQPSYMPSSQPSTQPSSNPTTQPSMQPSRVPSSQPTSQPSSNPTAQPSMQPSGMPSSHPTAQPTASPSYYLSIDLSFHFTTLFFPGSSIRLHLPQLSSNSSNVGDDLLILSSNVPNYDRIFLLSWEEPQHRLIISIVNTSVIEPGAYSFLLGTSTLVITHQVIYENDSSLTYEIFDDYSNCTIMAGNFDYVASNGFKDSSLMINYPSSRNYTSLQIAFSSDYSFVHNDLVTVYIPGLCGHNSQIINVTGDGSASLAVSYQSSPSAILFRFAAAVSSVNLFVDESNKFSIAPEGVNNGTGLPSIALRTYDGKRFGPSAFHTFTPIAYFSYSYLNFSSTHPGQETNVKVYLGYYSGAGLEVYDTFKIKLPKFWSSTIHVGIDDSDFAVSWHPSNSLLVVTALTRKVGTLIDLMWSISGLRLPSDGVDRQLAKHIEIETNATNGVIATQLFEDVELTTVMLFSSIDFQPLVLGDIVSMSLQFQLSSTLYAGDQLLVTIPSILWIGNDSLIAYDDIVNATQLTSVWDQANGIISIYVKSTIPAYTIVRLLANDSIILSSYGFPGSSVLTISVTGIEGNLLVFPVEKFTSIGITNGFVLYHLEDGYDSISLQVKFSLASGYLDVGDVIYVFTPFVSSSSSLTDSTVVIATGDYTGNNFMSPFNISFNATSSVFQMIANSRIEPRSITVYIARDNLFQLPATILNTTHLLWAEIASIGKISPISIEYSPKEIGMFSSVAKAVLSDCDLESGCNIAFDLSISHNLTVGMQLGISSIGLNRLVDASEAISMVTPSNGSLWEYSYRASDNQRLHIQSEYIEAIGNIAYTSAHVPTIPVDLRVPSVMHARSVGHALTHVPRVLSVYSNSLLSALICDDYVILTVVFSEAVILLDNGRNSLYLNTLENANYLAGNSSNELKFIYRITNAAKSVSDLQVYGFNALNQSAIYRAADPSIPANTTIPSPFGSLYRNRGLYSELSVSCNDTAHVIKFEIYNRDPNRLQHTYYPGSFIDFALTFDREITVYGKPSLVIKSINLLSEIEAEYSNISLVQWLDVIPPSNADMLGQLSLSYIGEVSSCVSWSQAGSIQDALESMNSLQESLPVNIDVYAIPGGLTYRLEFLGLKAPYLLQVRGAICQGYEAQASVRIDSSMYSTAIMRYVVQSKDLSTVYSLNTSALSIELPSHYIAVSGHQLLPPQVSLDLTGVYFPQADQYIRISTESPYILSVYSNFSSSNRSIARSGDAVFIFIQFSAPIELHGNVSLLLDILTSRSMNRVATYNSVEGNLLTLVYLVQIGDTSPLFDYQDSDSLVVVGELVLAGANATLANVTLPSHGSANSLATSNITIDGDDIPKLLSVSSIPGRYSSDGYPIPFHLQFSDLVTIIPLNKTKLENVTLSLFSSSSEQELTLRYLNGSGSPSLVFTTLVESRLNVFVDFKTLAYPILFVLHGGVFEDYQGDTWTNISYDRPLNSLVGLDNITFDTFPSAVIGVDSAYQDGTYFPGQTLDLLITFTKPVAIIGDENTLPKLELFVVDQPAISQLATYKSGNMTNTLQFQYIIPVDDYRVFFHPFLRLDYGGVLALSSHLNSSRIMEYSSFTNTVSAIAADTDLPPADQSFLFFHRQIFVNFTAIHVLNVTVLSAAGTYTAGDHIDLVVYFSQSVMLFRSPVLRLHTAGETNRSAIYVQGNMTRELIFRYDIEIGDSSTKLDYVDTRFEPYGLNTYSVSLALNTDIFRGENIKRINSREDLGYIRSDDIFLYPSVFGGIFTLADVPAKSLTPVNTALPLPRKPGSISFAKSITIDTRAPYIRRVYSTSPSSTIGITADSRAVTIVVEFSTAVVVKGCPRILFIINNQKRYAQFVDGSGTTTLRFGFSIREFDYITDFDYYDSRSFELFACTNDSYSLSVANDFYVRRAAVIPTINANLTMPSTKGRDTVLSPTSITASDVNIIISSQAYVKAIDSSFRSNRSFGIGDNLDVVIEYNTTIRARAMALALKLADNITPLYLDNALDLTTKRLKFFYSIQLHDVSKMLSYSDASALISPAPCQLLVAASGLCVPQNLPKPGDSIVDRLSTRQLSIRSSEVNIAGIRLQSSTSVYYTGETIVVFVSFTEAIYAYGRPSILMLYKNEQTKRLFYNPDILTDPHELAFSFDITAAEGYGDFVCGDESRLELNGGKIFRQATFLPIITADTRLPDCRDVKAFILQSIPSVVRVYLNSSGTLSHPKRIFILVEFSRPVRVRGSVKLQLDLPHHPYASFDQNWNEHTLIFHYDIRTEDSTSDLDYASTDSLTIVSSGVYDGVLLSKTNIWVPANLSLPCRGCDGSLGISSSVVIDRNQLRIVNVSASPTIASTGDDIMLSINYNGAISILGPISCIFVNLTVGSSVDSQKLVARGISYDSSANKLLLRYSVRDADLPGSVYLASSLGFMSQSGCSVTSAATNTTTSTAIPTAFVSTALFTINVDVPQVRSVYSNQSTGSISEGNVIDIYIVMSFPVSVLSSPRLRLRLLDGISYAQYLGSYHARIETLHFSWTVRSHEYANLLEYDGVDALSGDIRRFSSSPTIKANLTLPIPGAEGSLSYCCNIRVDSSIAFVEYLMPLKQAGVYGVGENILILLRFSKAVRVFGSPMLALRTKPGENATDSVSYASYVSSFEATDLLVDILDTDVLFLYTVRADDQIDSLRHANAEAIILGNSSITYRGSPANLTLREPDEFAPINSKIYGQWKYGYPAKIEVYMRDLYHSDPQSLSITLRHQSQSATIMKHGSLFGNAFGRSYPQSRSNAYASDTGIGYNYFFSDSLLTNIALASIATQSSTIYSADRAIDGNTNPRLSENSVTETYDIVNSWWQLQLPQNSFVQTIRVFSRQVEFWVPTVIAYTVKGLDKHPLGSYQLQIYGIDSSNTSAAVLSAAIAFDASEDAVNEVLNQLVAVIGTVAVNRTTLPVCGVSSSSCGIGVEFGYGYTYELTFTTLTESTIMVEVVNIKLTGDSSSSNQFQATVASHAESLRPGYYLVDSTTKDSTDNTYLTPFYVMLFDAKPPADLDSSIAAAVWFHRYESIGDSLTITLPKKCNTSYLKIQRDGSGRLSLAEVEIYGDAFNTLSAYALGKPVAPTALTNPLQPEKSFTATFSDVAYDGRWELVIQADRDTAVSGTISEFILVITDLAGSVTAYYQDLVGESLSLPKHGTLTSTSPGTSHPYGDWRSQFEVQSSTHLLGSAEGVLYQDACLSIRAGLLSTLPAELDEPSSVTSCTNRDSYRILGPTALTSPQASYLQYSRYLIFTPSINYLGPDHFTYRILEGVKPQEHLSEQKRLTSTSEVTIHVRNCRAYAAQIANNVTRKPHPLCQCDSSEAAILSTAAACYSAVGHVCSSNQRTAFPSLCLVCIDQQSAGLQSKRCYVQINRAMSFLVSRGLCSREPIMDCSSELMTIDGKDSVNYLSLSPPLIDDAFTATGTSIGGYGWFESGTLN